MGDPNPEWISWWHEKLVHTSICSCSPPITREEKWYKAYQIQNWRLAPWTLIVVALLRGPPVNCSTDVVLIRLSNPSRAFNYDRRLLRLLSRSPTRSSVQADESKKQQPHLHVSFSYLEDKTTSQMCVMLCKTSRRTISSWTNSWNITTWCEKQVEFKF